jgi:uncharacterized protein YqgQ
MFYVALNVNKLRVLYCNQFLDKEMWLSAEQMLTMFCRKLGLHMQC